MTMMVKPIDTLDVYIAGRLVGELRHLPGRSGPFLSGCRQLETL
jgi:hypothetical protein